MCVKSSNLEFLSFKNFTNLTNLEIQNFLIKLKKTKFKTNAIKFSF